MKLEFINSDPKLVPQAVEIVRKLQQAGYTAYFAGGCVRDALRAAPVKDIDIATSATPEEVATLFPAQNIGVGKSFGVMLVVLNTIAYDVATFRTDGGYQDGRHPESITYDTAEHDAQRRDFTVNALFYDPVAEKVIDFVGGVADLKAGILRTVGDPVRRFQEDRLRMLRAIRFSAVCGWTIEATTWEAIKQEAPALPCVSMERIRTEFTRTLCEAIDPAAALELLVTSGLLKLFFPELLRLRGCLQDPVWHPEGDVWAHTVKMLNAIPAPRDPELVWAVLLHDIGKPDTLVVSQKPDGSPWYRTPNHASVGARQAETILKRFKQSNDFLERVTTAVRYHMQFVELPKMRPSNLRHVLGRETIQLELALHRLDCLSSHAKLDIYDYALEQLEAFKNESVLPPPALTGKDLIAMGYRPGVKLGKRLKEAYTAQLDGATREELLLCALREVPFAEGERKTIAFVVNPDGSIPFSLIWNARKELVAWDVALIVPVGTYWDKPLPEGAKLLRLVGDCAGNVDYASIGPFNLLLAADTPPPDLAARAKAVITA